MILLLPVLFGPVAAQENQRPHLEVIPDTVPYILDSLYREDQFYLGFSLNFIRDKPEAISQSSYSGGFNAGFIRDFPLNRRRNMAVGIGIGWAFDTFGQNLFIGQDVNGQTIFRALEGELDYDSNRFTFHQVEFPVEFRWRTSTMDTYKFWRIYSGLRLGYIYHFRSNFRQPENQVKQFQVEELERFRLGSHFTFGYNTFNFTLYYSLNSLFPDAFLEEEEIGIHPIRIGLTFFIL